MTAEKMFSVDEAATILGIHPMTVRKWLSAGIIRGVKVGRLWRIPDSALDEIAQSGTRRGIKPVSKMEIAMRVRVNTDSSNYSYRCNECGNEWFPYAGGGDGEELLKMICPEGCNKPEGFDEEETRVLNEWFEDHEEEFQEYLSQSKQEDGEEDTDEEEDDSDYEANVRLEWEAETSEDREAWVHEQMASWMEEEVKGKIDE